MDKYKDLVNKELKDNFSDWSFSKEMQNASRNPMWKNKTGLWTLLSAACDEAASKCYSHINRFSSELIDIDTCNIHALKSIAKSVDLSYLCNRINENFPLDVIDLMNLFSVPKYYLLNKNVILNESSNHPLFGEIAKRIVNIDEEKISVILLNDIAENIIHIKNILNNNMIFTSRKLKDLLKHDFKFNDKMIDRNDKNNLIYNFTLNTVIERIIKLNSENNSLSNYSDYKLYISNDTDPINYFYILINVIKQNIYNEEYDFFISPIYFNKDENCNIDLTGLFIDIINILFSSDENYIKYFICFHFYNLFSNKLKNDNLKNMFSYDINDKMFYLNKNINSDYSKHDFFNKLKEFLNDIEINELITETCYNENNELYNVNIGSNYTQYVIDFAEYLKYVNDFIIKNHYNNHKKKEFNIVKINYPKYFKEENDLFSEDYVKEINQSNSKILMSISKELTDITLNISYIRKQIKTSILQYNFVGTKRIATDILTDFFLKNYSNPADWGYISDSSNQYSSITNDNIELFKPISSLMDQNDESKRFSIDVIEYYDTTKYLNIESKLGSAYAGSYVSRIDETPKYFIDSNNLIASSLVSTKIYEDVYVPCSYFFKDYNERFWTNEFDELGESNKFEDIKFENYDSFYNQYIPDYSLLNKEDKKNFIKNELSSLLSDIWDTFALSSYDNSFESDVSPIYRKYIGNEFGEDRLKNLKNKYFPTIAANQHIEGLIKTSEIDKDNILFLAKIYYSELFESIYASTKEMIKMHDKNGIPFEDWRQKYVDFHGYSTYYELSNNKSDALNEMVPYCDFDGPWSYSFLQKVIFDRMNIIDDNTNENNNKIYDYLVYDVNVEDILEEDLNLFKNLKDIYNYYIIDRNIFLNNELKDVSIAKIENDIYNNTFTLFKKNNLNYGKIYFRSSDMKISLPLAVFENKEELYSNYSMFFIDNKHEMAEFTYLINNCIDFGIINDIFWIFSKSDEIKNKYKLCSFKYVIKYNRIFIIENSIRYYTEPSSIGNSLNSINDFIGVKYDNEDNSLNAFIFDSINSLYDLAYLYENNKDNKEIILFKYNLPIIHIKLDMFSLEKHNSTIYSKDSIFPSILYHNNPEEDPHNEKYDESHSVWKLETFKNRYYICYEALNETALTESANIFDYYFDILKQKIYFENIIFEFSLKNHFTVFDTDSSNIYYSFMKVDFSKNSEKIMYDEFLNINTLILNLVRFSFDFPKCYLKNGKKFVSIIPISLFKNFKNEAIIMKCFYRLFDLYERELLSNNINTISFDFINENFNKIFDEKYIDFNEDEELEQFKMERNIFKNQLDYIISLKNEFRNNKNDDPRLNVKLTFNTKKQDLIENEKLKQLTKNKETNDNENITIPEYDLLINDIFKNIPIVKKCIFGNLKIVVWFKNLSGITFIGDHALDLDLICYINDEVEKHKKVGYYGGYKNTKYISWNNDATKGEHESLNINVLNYIENRYVKNSFNKNMQIVLNTCWFYESEIQNNDVYISVLYNNIRQDINLDIVGLNKKECNERSIVFNIDMEHDILTYEKPKLYFAIKLTLKTDINGYTDIVPDIQVGIINMIDSELDLIKKKDSWVDFKDKDFIIYNEPNKNGRQDLNYKYLTILFKHGYEMNISNSMIRVLVKTILNDVFKLSGKNYLTNYNSLCLNDIYFGYDYNNEDRNTNINYVYSSFIRNDIFYNYSDHIYRYPILNLIDKSILLSIQSLIGEI